MAAHDEDLWFLPAAPEASAPTDPPWRQADNRPLVDVGAWLRAEAALAAQLARAAAAFAALDERLRGAAVGVRRRLALTEAEALLWADGTRMRLESIALYDALRLAPASADPAALSEASWAARRLSGGPGPEAGLRGFLGRVAVGRDGLDPLAQRPVGAEFDALEAAWCRMMDLSEAAHPITRAAISSAAWIAFGLSRPGARLEAAVSAARLGAVEARGGATFLPLAAAQGTARGGNEVERLAGWYAGVRDGALAGLMLLDRLDAWRARASLAVGGMKGRTPALLIETLVNHPAVSAEMLESRAAVSRAAAERNLTAFEGLGLIQELTGQKRFRFWSARM